MKLNHSKSIKTVLNLYRACHTKKETCSRDATVLIDLLWFNVVHYSSLFQYFLSTMVSTLVENS